MANINPATESELRAAAMAEPIIRSVMLEQFVYWTCLHCGFDRNSILTEVCRQCDVEDCGQGDPTWVESE